MDSNQPSHHQVIIVGAGPGGLSTAIALQKHGTSDVVLIDRGDVGQAWADYPPETRLLSASGSEQDDNMIADTNVFDVIGPIPHPTHMLYQQYLRSVAQKNNLTIQRHTPITTVTTNPDGTFLLTTQDNQTLSCTNLIWATGMYSTPDEHMDCTGCFIHYSRIQDWNHITDTDVTVIGGANGATEVVLQLAKPGRIVHLICSRNFEIPEPQDELWKENRKLVHDLSLQGLVEITENYRVKRIYHDDEAFIVESTDGQIKRAFSRPIICIGFLPNIEPVKEMVETVVEDHDLFLNLDEHCQSKKTPHLFFAGTIAKHTHDEGFIKGFREFGARIAEAI